MAIEVFNRYENKYILDTATLEKLTDELKEHLEADKHNANGRTYRINSIYFDTADNNLIRTSLDKPKYKEKLRLRSYGEFEDESIVFLEMKKKYKGVGNKRRTKIKFKEAMSFVATGNMPEYQPYMNRQVLNELHYMINRERLMPKKYISYDRLAFFSTEDSSLRITIDTNITADTPLLEKGLWLMEIKSASNLPLWLSHILSKHKIYKSSFSKYGTAYEKELAAVQESRQYYLTKNYAALQRENERGICDEFNIEYNYS